MPAWLWLPVFAVIYLALTQWIFPSWVFALEEAMPGQVSAQSSSRADSVTAAAFS